jgi:arsenical pump membrane protein
MEHAVAYSTLAMTVGLAVSRPRIGLGEWRVTPGAAAVLGVAILLVSGLLSPEDLWSSARIQWRPLLALTCIMITTGVVKEVGAFERLARRLEAHARTASISSVFNLIFVASAVTPSLLNNDAAILLLTPVVIALARRCYPDQPRVLEAFVFAVFLAPGVAPFVISNPMNMIVAEFAGVGFNAYAAIMVPISLAGALLTFAILRLHYRDVLAPAPSAEPGQSPTSPPSPRPWPRLTSVSSSQEVPRAHPAERPALAFLLTVFCSYPVMAACGGPIWSVAVLGALGALAIARIYGVAPARKLAGHVSIDILAFLWGVFLVVAGLRSVGVVDALAGFYHAVPGHGGPNLGVVGVTSALGSALVDNHPMSILNMMALHGDGNSRPLLAALIGGDIGPRLLPIGSLAGLLWMDLLRRRGLEIKLRTFVRLGTLVLIPTLALSLLMLWALAR